MLQKVFATGIAFFCLQLISAQQATVAADTTPVKKTTTTISGFADCYYRYDPALTTANNKTSFTNSDKSFELGMISAKAEQQFGRASMVADLGFGRRAEEFAYTDAASKVIIKQLYLSYNFKHDIKVTAGSLATHVGYELVDPYANRNYSMSYMFSYGPFFHTGLKAEKAFGKTGIMLGVANPTDLKSASLSSKYVIGQISTKSKNDKLAAFLNFQAGQPIDSVRVSQFDLVATYAISDMFSVGANATMYNVQLQDSEGYNSPDSWMGGAIYLNANPTSWLGITLRSEYFDDSKQLNVFASAAEGGSILANTLSFNLSNDHITLIPEVRFEKATADIYVDKDGAATDKAVSFLCAAIYKF